MPAAKRAIADLLREEPILFLDGAMGTMIQSADVSGLSCPEEMNLSRPRLLEEIHRAYASAGARVVETNTFGANPHKLGKVGLASRLREIVESAVAAARTAVGDRALVAGSAGPLGDFVEPVGSIPFSRAREMFLEVARSFRRAGADFLIFETMSDIREVRAACLAASEADIPFAVTMTFEEDGRTVLGTPPESAVVVAESLGAVMVGVNCSLGPAGLLPVARRMGAVARVPLLVQPNAGMPTVENGRTVHPTGPEEFAREMESFLGCGVKALGGCCGTTPAHIERLVGRLTGRKPAPLSPSPGCRLASRTSFVLVGAPHPIAVIGERVNPTGRRRMASELANGDLGTVKKELLDQAGAGAALLDLNAGGAGLDESSLLPRMVELAQRLVRVPLSIDTTHPDALAASLEAVEGRCLVNSVSASDVSLETVLPLAARHGAALIGLAMDEKGIPPDARGRLRLAEKIVRRAADLGFRPEDLLIDCLTMAVGADQPQAMETLRALSSLRAATGAGSVLGVSNVSYGLPARESLNASFLSMAAFCGLDAAIVNPYAGPVMDALRSSMVITGRDPGATAFVAVHAGNGQPAPKPAGEETAEELMTRAVLEGDAEALLDGVKAALESGSDPASLGRDILIPALERVGELFETKAFFLPQVIAAAEAARAAFALISERTEKSDEGKRDTILLATVEGDVHDLGKNIVGSLLENYGYRIVDMGINVPAAAVAERVGRGDIRLVGLSALMTTTLPALEATIRLLASEHLQVPVIVGGAVLTEAYAASVGAAGYAPDASQAVRLVRRLLQH